MRLSARKLLAINRDIEEPPGSSLLPDDHAGHTRRLGIQKQLVRADRRTLYYVSKADGYAFHGKRVIYDHGLSNRQQEIGRRIRSDCAEDSVVTGGKPSVCWPAAAFTNDSATRQAARLIAAPYHCPFLMASLQDG